MKKFVYAAIMVSSITFLTACSNESGTEKESVSDMNVQEAEAASGTLTPSAAPEPSTGAQDLNATPAQSAGADNGKVALNPEHGQPGHDCAVAVGAPLNGKPSSSVNTTQVQPAINAVPVAAPNTGSGKVNPAHGQPGHDCAVAVGAPLPG